MTDRIAQAILTYKANEKSLKNAVIKAGGTEAVVDQEEFISVLTVLARNNIIAVFAYCGDSDGN